ncbi:hypothetical protein HOP50_06g40710 [Chloropicon primus]|nr:hypothetical protein HOP50_06g40710 [Chloropicon primus]
MGDRGGKPGGVVEGRTRITFSPSFLESSGLVGGFGSKGPLTLTLDDAKLDECRSEPCVITLARRNTTGTTSTTSTTSSSNAGGLTRTYEDVGVGSDTAGSEEEEEAVSKLAETVSCLSRERAREAEALGSVTRDLDTLAEEVENLSRQVRGSLRRERGRREPEEVALVRRRGENHNNIGTQTEEEARGGEAEGVRQEQGDSDEGASRWIDLVAKCFFDQCVTHAARRVEVPGGERDPPKSAEADLFVLDHLSTRYFEQLLSEAKEEVLPVETKEEEVLPVETKEEEVLPVETKEEEVLPVETKGEEVLPVETKGEEVLPVETKGEEVLPVETKEEETLPSGTGPRSREELQRELEWTVRALNERLAFLKSREERRGGTTAAASTK